MRCSGPISEGHRDEIRTVDLGLAAFVCVTTVEALAHRAVLHHPDVLSEEGSAAFVDEASGSSSAICSRVRQGGKLPPS